jgi:uncharacterized protein YdeI (YjbR/CyaY-like superfamily)
MSADVRAALVEHALVEAYRARPPYRRNDYLAWIKRAKLPATRTKRLQIMVRELAARSGYMGLVYRVRR